MSDSSTGGGELLVVRGGREVFVRVGKDGRVTAYNGHVDLGTGIGTALAQIVAEELDVAFEAVTVVLGDSGVGPDQGATIASETIQITAVPLRHAAAQARHYLVAEAALRFDLPSNRLAVTDGVVADASPGSNLAVSYGELLRGRRVVLELDGNAPVKLVAEHRVVGRSVPRADLPAKATGQFVYVHDMRVPGMLHGRVVRPPYAGVDCGEFVGTSLISVDEASIAHVPGIVGVVVIGDFIGIVAEREEHADLAARTLATRWKPIPALPDLGDIETALSANPSVPRTLLDRGNVDAALAGAAARMPRTYSWPYQMHGSIGPSCSLADWRDGALTVWSGTQNPLPLRAALAQLLDLPEAAVTVIRLEAAGCYGRNCADDVGADAALLSRAVGRPVRVQLTREQEHAWEPKGAAQLMQVDGGLTSAGAVAGYDFQVRYPSNGAPILAALLTGAIAPVPAVFEMGDRTAIPPYDYAAARVVVHDMAPIVRASWLRGVSSLPNTFAHESYIDELAAAAFVDPVEFRLRYLPDPRGAELVRATAARAGWVAHVAPGQEGGAGDLRHGRGFAYALYVHSRFPGYGAAWSAWVADVSVNVATGEVAVSRVVVGQDSGLMINPAGVQQQIHGNVIQSTSRALKEAVSFDRAGVVSREWGAYPIITFSEVPRIDVLMLQRPDQPPLGVGESASVPSAAAIANAIYDATGVRFREPPFTPERILAGLGRPPPAPRRRRWRERVGAAMAGAAGLCAAVAWHAPIDPVAPPDPTTYSAATIERGRQLAAVGNCDGCHAEAGGLAMQTPFGVVYASNITPDVQTGIGAWSYPAFERAMRHGIGADGGHLYPAFPYTSFTRATDADLQALYAYLMAQPPVSRAVPQTRLPLPFARPAMAAWNALFLRPGAYAPDPARSPAWNRGAYLVEGLGHCGGCHSPRNAMGAERGGALHLAGGVADGWEAPALSSLSRAPVGWTETALFEYLRTGFSPHHGVAAGPMAQVVRSLAGLQETDVRAMAIYLASFAAPAGDPALAERLESQAELRRRPASSNGARIFDGACAACHAAGGPDLLGVKPSLALNTSLHAAAPTNLIHVILDGIAEPATSGLGAMPGFGGSLGDGQVAELVSYLRATYAPGQPAWQDVPETIARLRGLQARR